MKKEDTDFKLDEDKLESWGDQLSDDSHPAEAMPF
jgi:hypothetical protein